MNQLLLWCFSSASVNWNQFCYFYFLSEKNNQIFQKHEFSDSWSLVLSLVPPLGCVFPPESLLLQVEVRTCNGLFCVGNNTKKKKKMEVTCSLHMSTVQQPLNVLNIWRNTLRDSLYEGRCWKACSCICGDFHRAAVGRHPTAARKFKQMKNVFLYCYEFCKTWERYLGSCAVNKCGTVQVLCHVRGRVQSTDVNMKTVEFLLSNAVVKWIAAYWRSLWSFSANEWLCAQSIVLC